MTPPLLAPSRHRQRQPSDSPNSAGTVVNDLSSLVRQALDEVTGVGDLAALDEARVRWLGKKGTLTEQLKSLGALPAAERPAAGQKINEAKQSVQSALDARRVALEQAEIESKLSAGRIDVTLPGRGEERGGLHPVTKARLRIEQLFRRAGFDDATGSADRNHRAGPGLPQRSRHDPFADVSSAGRVGRRREREFRQHESGAARISAGVFRERPRHAVAALLLSVHRAFGRSGHV